jgi:NTE family protein
VAPLGHHPLFAGVSRSAIDRLAQRAQVRRFAAGEIILRAGDASSELYGLLSGAARVELPGGGAGRRFVLAPPQSFGEMSALSGSTVSATVVALRDTETWVLVGADLFEVLGEEPAFFRNVSALLGARLRHRTSDPGRSLWPAVTVLVADHGASQIEPVLQGLFAGVRHYAPASVCLNAYALGTDALLQRVQQWRAEGAGGQVLLLCGRTDQVGPLRPVLEPVDLLVRVAGAQGEAPSGNADAGAADIATLRVAPRIRAASEERWAHAVEAETFAAAAQRTGFWARQDWPDLDRLVRQICGREIGLAMSVGAAAGLAHLGLLEVLEDAGIPLDFLCGSSMGGIAAIAYAHFGSARIASDRLCSMAGEFARNKGLQWLPRAGLVSTARMEAISRSLFGQAQFADLRTPVAVVAADLVAGRPKVLEKGALAIAARATGAIPGLFPPVRVGDAMLVDGGLVTRVPVDLLAARHCGLKLAALIAPQKGGDSTTAGQAAAASFRARLDRPFGLRTVLGASWSLLGWWDSVAQAQRADVIIRIPTVATDSFNFAAGRALVDCGRRAAQSQLPAIREAVQRILAPGVP